MNSGVTSAIDWLGGEITPSIRETGTWSEWSEWKEFRRSLYPDNPWVEWRRTRSRVNTWQNFDSDTLYFAPTWEDTAGNVVTWVGLTLIGVTAYFIPSTVLLVMTGTTATGGVMLWSPYGGMPAGTNPPVPVGGTYTKTEYDQDFRTTYGAKPE
ncbi:hypothetical protein [Proteiniphilum sp. UBA7639]|uniref:hypothetical protein n=1 Tax=Proteiniphilum sp. UBA7639 TaxID=1947289 RepID=UPI00257C8DDA|nr:hypothetical protein [Proteiniphilum sp. UBA7639]